MNRQDEVFCETLVECFVSMIRYGTVGDYGDVSWCFIMTVCVGKMAFPKEKRNSKSQNHWKDFEKQRQKLVA